MVIYKTKSYLQLYKKKPILVNEYKNDIKNKKNQLIACN